MFPEYGAGFLAACLSSCGHDAERVIHQLLEGSLPPELSRLDPKMPLQPVDGKGKGKARADDIGGISLHPWISSHVGQHCQCGARAATGIG